MPQTHCLNQKELARRWGISHRTPERWRYAGQGPAFLKLGARVLYLPRPRIEISGPQGVQATFDWQAARDSAVGRMCAATLINNIEVY